MAVGRSSATSSAWVGPESATTRTPCRPGWLSTSLWITWLMVISEPASMPLATSTIT